MPKSQKEMNGVRVRFMTGTLSSVEALFKLGSVSENNRIWKWLCRPRAIGSVS